MYTPRSDLCSFEAHCEWQCLLLLPRLAIDLMTHGTHWLQAVMLWPRRTGLTQQGVSVASLKTYGHKSSQRDLASGQMAA